MIPGVQNLHKVHQSSAHFLNLHFSKKRKCSVRYLNNLIKGSGHKMDLFDQKQHTVPAVSDTPWAQLDQLKSTRIRLYRAVISKFNKSTKVQTTGWFSFIIKMLVAREMAYQSECKICQFQKLSFLTSLASIQFVWQWRRTATWTCKIRMRYDYSDLGLLNSG